MRQSKRGKHSNARHMGDNIEFREMCKHADDKKAKAKERVEQVTGKEGTQSTQLPHTHTHTWHKTKLQIR